MPCLLFCPDVAIREIRTWGDPVLRTPCDEVTVFDASIESLCRDLLDTVTGAEGRAGLAANQIGVSLRAFSWYVDDRSGVVVNPRLVETRGEQEGDEGCLSLPGLWFPRTRANYAAVEGVDAHGEPVRVAGDALLGRCLQHECDHLDGMLYIDALTGDLRKQALRAAREL